jgi:HSP20 family protein
MSFFPRAFVNNNDSSFTPLFRLLDDFDQYSRGTNPHHHRGGIMKTFSPKFDVKELADAYELHGELPGIEQKDVEIEFTDAQTLSVRGRTERSYTSNSPNTGSIEDPAATGTITEGGETNGHKAHQPTVEDEEAGAKGEKETTTEVAVTKENPTEPEVKYWVSERSIGEFSRSFSFPVRVDSEQAHASMKNGILSILVPKAKKLESRKITIS